MSKPKTGKPFAKKSFGQNFLVDQNYIDKIITALELNNDDLVIEIGPGRGALTEGLIKEAGKVIAIELDRDLIPITQEKFAAADNFHLIESDALKTDFTSLVNIQSPRKKAKLVANLPYYISTAILQKLIEHREVFSEMILMFQREVVERMTAQPGDSERGYLSVIVEANLEVETLFDVPPQAFKPIPKIWSSVVRLTPKSRLITDRESLRLFELVVSAAFRQKRKTILNNLKRLEAIEDSYPGGAPELLKDSGIDPARRAETLSIDEWLKLTSNLEKTKRR